jgi:hypothetical protein
VGAPFETGLEAHPVSYTVGTVSFSGVKQPGRGVDHPHPSIAEIKERLEVYIFSHSFYGELLPLPFYVKLSLSPPYLFYTQLFFAFWV